MGGGHNGRLSVVMKVLFFRVPKPQWETASNNDGTIFQGIDVTMGDGSLELIMWSEDQWEYLEEKADWMLMTVSHSLGFQRIGP